MCGDAFHTRGKFKCVERFFHDARTNGTDDSNFGKTRECSLKDTGEFGITVGYMAWALANVGFR